MILAATAGGCRRVLQPRGEDVDDLELRRSVPVDLESLEDRAEAALGRLVERPDEPDATGDDRVRHV